MMGEADPLSEPRREFIADGDHSSLRATWHRESGFVVLSLWRGDTCVGTSHMTPKEAGRLATFITAGLADLATETASSPTVGEGSAEGPFSGKSSRLVHWWRANAARSLESLARSLRSR
jgi:hypothetical protein